MNSLNIHVSIIQNSKGKRAGEKLCAEKLESMKIRVVGYSALEKSVFMVPACFLQKVAVVLCV